MKVHRYGTYVDKRIDLEFIENTKIVAVLFSDFFLRFLIF